MTNGPDPTRMMFPSRAAWAALLALSAAGCVSTQPAAPRPQPLVQADLAVVDEKIRRSQGDVESLQMQVERLRDDLERIQANTATSFQTQIGSLENGLQSLQRQVNELEAQRARDRDEIVRKLSERMTQMLNDQSRARQSSSASRVSEYGYEHVVAAGETLSKIAGDYGVSVSSIIEANRLTNPDNLRVGQTLFIPN